MSLIINANSDFAIQSKPVLALAPAALSSNAVDWVNIQFYERLLIQLLLRNGAAAVSAATVTLEQAIDINGSNAKALSFSNAYVNEDCANKDRVVATAVASDTFDTDTTNNAQLLYAIEITRAMMDWDNGFNCARLVLSGGLNATVTVLYTAWPPNMPAILPSVIVD